MKNDQNNLVTVAGLRHVQSREPAVRRNPDFLVGEFLDPSVQLQPPAVLRGNAFYHRTSRPRCASCCPRRARRS